MADNRYGGYGRYGRGETWRGRSDNSIFSDDDGDRFDRGGGRWDRNHGRGYDEERGFFERAGDEIRSWFGDDEAERRRERDYRSNDPRDNWGGGRDYSRTRYGPGGFGAVDTGGGRGAFFGGGQGSDQHGNYRQWREQQIAALDRDYDDYCRERQQSFDREFDTWRTGRQTGSRGTSERTGLGAATSAGGVTGATGTSVTGGAPAEPGTTATGATATSGRTRTRS